MTPDLAHMEALKQRFAKNTEAPARNNGTGARFDVPRYLDHYGYSYPIKSNGSSTLHVLECCLFDPSHGRGEAAIIQTADGKLLYQCFHNSCQGRIWADAREEISGKDSLKQFLEGENVPARTHGSTADVVVPVDIPTKSGDILSLLFKWDDIATLDVRTEWLLEKLIPKGAIILFFAPGGAGKTWLSLQIGRAIAPGVPFGDLKTVRTPVYYVDYENPLSVLRDRVMKIGSADDLYVWHLVCATPPPRLDGDDWTLYKSLPPGLLIFDTLRAANTGDENSSKDMAVVMGRLKELREAGFTIILLHHTPKGADNTFKGSTAILDLADHVIGLERQGKNEDDEFDVDATFKFGCRIKTRFEPYTVFLSFNPDRGFSMKEDPDIEAMRIMADTLKREGRPLKQKEFKTLLEQKLDMKERRARYLMKKGAGIFWTREAGETGHSIVYNPMMRYDTSKDVCHNRHIESGVIAGAVKSQSRNDQNSLKNQQCDNLTGVNGTIVTTGADFEATVKHYIAQGMNETEARFLARQEC